MTFNMSGAFLNYMPFNIIKVLMYVLCMQARMGAQTPPDAIWSILVNVRRFFGPWTPCWQRGGLDGYLWRDARAAGHGCFIISKQNSIER